MKEKEKNYLKKFAKECTLPVFDRELYAKYDVKRGLRDINGKGVVAGLTNISEIKASEIVDGKSVPAEGELYYRGYPIEELVGGCLKDGRFGFEEVAYLLLTGKLPTAKELDEFRKYLTSFYTLPKNFVRDIIMKSPSEDMMNTLIRSVLALFPYDAKANDTSIENVVRQCVMLTAVLPIFTVYSYAACNFYKKGESLIIHRPRTDLSTAENILYMLRPDCSYTELEARVLDLALILHAEHGGGNNSTFTTHVVTSSGTDTYSAVAAALCSLKGPKHGGANIKVVEMMNDLKKHVRDTSDADAVRDYLEKLLSREAFDKKGLIYGMGHAVYSVSDPRAEVFKGFVEKLAHEKGRDEDFALYSMIDRLAPQVIAERRKIYKGVSPNVDFYSGFVYSMLDIPLELYTPIFAMARVVGWSAHMLEELHNVDKIIRPAYKSVSDKQAYRPIAER